MVVCVDLGVVVMVGDSAFQVSFWFSLCVEVLRVVWLFGAWFVVLMYWVCPCFDLCSFGGCGL